MTKGNILMTLAELRDSSTSNKFVLKQMAAKEDCIFLAKNLSEIGYNVYFVNWDDFNQDGEFDRMFLYNVSEFISPEKVDNMDLIFVIKQEGFLNDLPRFFKLLKRFEDSNAIIVNDPKTIKMNLSKEYLYALERNGINIIPTYPLDLDIINRVRTGEKFVIKPKIGERGLDLHLITKVEDLEPFMLDREHYIAQKYCSDVKKGERSLIFIGSDYSHSVIKTPNPKKPNEYRCNFSKGGYISRYDPTKKELDFAKKIIEKWESFGVPVMFTRIDLLDIDGDPILIESELLNPTIFADVIGLGDEFGKKLANYFNQLINVNKESKLEKIPLIN